MSALLMPTHVANKVYVKISLGKGGRIPSWIPYQDNETETEGVQRRDRNAKAPAGQRLFATQNNEKISVVRLLEDLDAADYSLVSVRRQVCQHKNPNKGSYHVVKLIFAHDSDVKGEKTPLETFKSLCEVNQRNGVNVVTDLQDLLDGAFWSAVAYDNPRTDGERMISINLNVPEDRYTTVNDQATGEKQRVLIKRRVKDVNGVDTGERQFIQPTYDLLFTPDCYVLPVEPLEAYRKDN